MIKGSIKQEITITLLVLIGLAFIGGGSALLFYLMYENTGAKYSNTMN